MRGSMLPDCMAWWSLTSSALVFFSRKFTPQKVSLGIRSSTATPSTWPPVDRRVSTTPSPPTIARKEVGQIEVATNARVILHLQQAPLSVRLYGVSSFFYVLTASLLPLRLYGNNDGKTDAPTLLCFYRRPVLGHLVHLEGHLLCRTGSVPHVGRVQMHVWA